MRLFGFKIKVRYIATGKQYTFAISTDTQEGHAVYTDRITEIGDNKIGIHRANPRLFMEYVLEDNCYIFDATHAVRGIKNIEVVNIQDVPLEYNTTERRFLKKWEKFIDTPDVRVVEYEAE